MVAVAMADRIRIWMGNFFFVEQGVTRDGCIKYGTIDDLMDQAEPYKQLVSALLAICTASTTVSTAARIPC
jgi:hypothetical protein